jgi:hypothetical protein
VRNVTQDKINGLDFGTTYYFTTTAYNTAGFESAHSNEVVYTPWPPPRNEILVQAFQNMSFDDDASDTAYPRGWSAWWPESWVTPGRSRTDSDGESRTGARRLIHLARKILFIRFSAGTAFRLVNIEPKHGRASFLRMVIKTAAAMFGKRSQPVDWNA